MRIKFPKEAIKYLSVFVSALIICSVSMILVYHLPVNKMKRHIKSSLPMYSKEGNYPSETGRILSGQRDDYTEGTMLLAAISSKESKIKDAFLSPISLVKGVKERDVLLKYALANEKDAKTGVWQYSRYWHGYLTILKPLLLFFTPGEIRYLNLLFQMLLFAAVLLSVNKVMGRKYAFSFAAVTAFLNPAAISMCFNFYAVFYSTLIFSLIALCFHETLTRRSLWGIFFMLGGIFTAFFDLLSYPVVALGIPLIIYIVLCKENIAGALKQSFIWGISYIGFWAGKWAMTALICRKNIMNDVINQIMFRLNSSGKMNQGGEYDFGLFEGISKNLSVLNNPVNKTIAVAFIIISIFLLKKKKPYMELSGIKENSAQITAIAFVMLYPFVWYLAVNNHSCVHFWFTWRVLSVSLWGLLVIFCLCVKRKSIS